MSIKDAKNGARVSLVVPCYNEENRLSEKNIDECLAALGKGAEIVLVDDGSTDGTAKLIKKIADARDGVKGLFLSRNGGKAGAVRAGMTNAVERGADFAGFCDADFAAPPEEVARVFKEMENSGAQAAMGTRNSKQSENITRSFSRSALSRVFSLVSSFALKRFVSDTQCGAKFFKNTPALKNALSEPFISRWGFDVEIVGRIEAENGEKTAEVPVKRWSEQPDSRMNFLSMAATLFELMEINGDLKKRRGGYGNRRELYLEIALTVFVRLIPLYILTYILTNVLFWNGYWINPDAYYHAGVAQAYAEHGWLDSFPWLKYTTLGDGFPNVYLLQHLLLGIVAFFTPSSDPTIILKTSIMALAFLQQLSFYFFLRKWKVSYASLWVFAGVTISSNMLWHIMALKGITLFSIILPWIVDALWSNNRRRAFIIGWISTYSYVGFILMGPLAACRAAGHLLFDGKLKIKTPLMLFAGVAAGILLSPFFPDHLTHIYRELSTVFERPSFIQAGDFFGSEWSIPDRNQLQHFIGGMVLLTIAATGYYMRKNTRADNVSGAAFITVFVFSLFPFVGGIKFAQTFAVIATLMVPLIFRDISLISLKIPVSLSRIVIALGALAGIGGAYLIGDSATSLGWLLKNVWVARAFVFIVTAPAVFGVLVLAERKAPEIVPAIRAQVPFSIRPALPVVFTIILTVYSLPFIEDRQRRTNNAAAPPPAAYEQISKVVKALTAKGKVVVAAWDDFPGFFYFNRDNYYISGMNNLFLYHSDSHRFTTYYKFFKAGIKNPAKSLPAVFDGTDLIVIRNVPRVDGERDLLKVLETAPGVFPVSIENGRFVAKTGKVAQYWRVYKIGERPKAKTPPEKK